MDDSQQLQQVRARIDALDEQIQRLLNERAELARQTAQIKQAAGLGENCFRPEREAEILRRVIARNPGPLSGQEMARLFREIMSACLALETPLMIAYLGPEGTFTEAAALKHFGHSVKTRPLIAIDEIFREVEAGTAHYGVVPVENSTEGAVTHTLDQFLISPLQICGEVELRIHHHLLSRSKTLAEVNRLYAHQQTLAQCRGWLDAHLAGCERIPVSSNAEAARRAGNEPDCAAIASDRAREIYGLQALAINIEDEPGNTTRFLVIGSQAVVPSGNDKTSLLLSGPNRSGLLYDLLRPLADNEISMTRLESRPSRRKLWEYVFFIDVEGHVDDPKVATALAALKDQASFLKLLGSYPRAVI
ncbi:chorismate mutase [Nitrosococcus halophilus Nc 4]|uniref:Bifunctional chorismate mutase/prephenate dehydratase n=1 Tax=Nitrosococcus halophilus (strain Nc4) TaxID=472759 RepID=D5BWQ0_NITHN|nr:prephenate dehydratase [Nitrosococcus halophilus]ADE15707.1 chorismate mutase [Nitrosococcus halophilus Nc 4]